MLMFALLQGCSTFQSKRRVDLTPFAQHLITMSEDIQYGLSEERAIWLRQYMDEPGIAVLITEYDEVTDRTRRILRGILAYSIEVVTLSQLEAPGPDKAVALAKYLEYLKEPSVQDITFDVHITAEDFDRILANIRTQKTLIDGVNAAQPVADEVARIIGEHISRVEVLQVRLDEAITASIEAEYGPQLKFMKTIKGQHAMTLQSLDLLLAYANGNQEALAELREFDAPLLRDIPERRNPTEDELMMLVDRLLDRLDKIERVRQSLRAGLEDYEAETEELMRLLLAHRTAVRKARATALAWAQAHRKLASGVVDPAKIDIFGMARQAVSGAL
jgi:hypothetical protein